jgi:hypothetical protein
MKIKIPRKLNIMQVAEWSTYCRNNPKPDELMAMVEAVSIVTKVPMQTVLDIALDDLTKLAEESLKVLSSYKMMENYDPDEFIEIEGKRFKLWKDTNKIPAGLVADIRKYGEDIVNKPDYFLATIYEPVGHDMDRVQRMLFFKDNFPADIYINVLGFFLSNSIKRSQAISLLQIARADVIRMEIAKYQRGGNGLTHFTKLRTSLMKAWIELRNFLTLLYLYGKSISLKNRK